MTGDHPGAQEQTPARRPGGSHTGRVASRHRGP
jgi:hypothetical protein